MVLPKKPISDTDNDGAHFNEGAQSQIQFCYADPDHKFLVDKVLQPGTGVTYDLFDPKEPEDAVAEPEPQLDDDGNPIPVPEKEPEEILPDKKIVEEVVREPRIHFFKVPKLGSYMAIRLEYETCLFEEALEAAVADCLSVNERIRVQAEEKAAWERQQQDLKDQADADGEPFNPEEKTWDEIGVQAYKTKKVQFVCCLNTMGQDRPFSKEE